MNSMKGNCREYNFIMVSFLPVKKSVIGGELQTYASGCWGLLPAFCRYPTDTHKKFRSLVKLLIPCIRKDAFMLEDIAIAVQVMSQFVYGVFLTFLSTSFIYICILVLYILYSSL